MKKISKRYIRQTSLTEIGTDGQLQLQHSSIAIVGCGGLGAICASYLAGAGIGEILLIDGDIPDVTNLHRQVFYQEKEKRSKSAALAAYLQTFNPEIKLDIEAQMLSKNNIDQLKNYDLVIECTDDIMCKYLVNDYCHLHNIPMIYGAIYKFDGYVSCFPNINESSIHLRDIFPVPNLKVPTCAEVGVMNTIAGLIGLLQANEALKYLLNIGDSLGGKLLTYNSLSNEQMKLKLTKNWNKSIEEVYDSNDYKTLGCKTINELEWEVYLNNISNYTLVSILEEDEHQSVNQHCLHHPMSSFDLNRISQGKPLLLYCMSGKRSAILSQQILDENPTQKLYSMSGGLIRYLAIKAEH